MNSKHLAAIIVALAAVLFVQVYFQTKTRLGKVEADLRTAESKAQANEISLRTEQASFAAIQASSATMMSFLNEWSGALGMIDSQEVGEITIATRVKQAGLIVLSQRFEAADSKNPTIPKLLRAHLSFEGDFVKALNWLGALERDLPSSRVTNLRIIRGETGNDLRVNLVVDLPVVKKDVLNTP